MKTMLRTLFSLLSLFFLCSCGLVVDEWPTDIPTAAKTATATRPPAATLTASLAPSATPTPAPSATAATPAASAPSTNPEMVQEQIGEAARNNLANRLGVEVATIALFQVVAQEWPDDCLGLLPAAGQECARMTVPGWQVILQVAERSYEYRATRDGQKLVYSGPIGYGAPPECIRAGASPFYAAEAGYCFVYPLRFHQLDQPNEAQVIGPAYGKGTEALFATLTVEVSPLTDGQTLEMAVEAFLAQFTASTNPAEIQRKALTLGGQPAVQLDLAAGQPGSRHVLAVYQERLYHLVFVPALEADPEVAKDAQELYQLVMESFRFVK